MKGAGGSGGVSGRHEAEAVRSKRASDQGAQDALDPDDAVDAIALAWLRERPGTPVDSIGVVTRLWQVSKLLGDDRKRLLSAEGADLATLDLLSTLRRAGPPYVRTTRELADSALLTAGAITQRVDRAERQGLVERLPREPGARRVHVQLTQEGHALVERLVDAVLQREMALLASLDDEQRDQLASLLRTLLAGLGDALGGTGRLRQVGS